MRHKYKYYYKFHMNKNQFSINSAHHISQYLQHSNNQFSIPNQLYQDSKNQIKHQILMNSNSISINISKDCSIDSLNTKNEKISQDYCHMNDLDINQIQRKLTSININNLHAQKRRLQTQLSVKIKEIENLLLNQRELQNTIHKLNLQLDDKKYNQQSRHHQIESNNLSQATNLNDGINTHKNLVYVTSQITQINKKQSQIIQDYQARNKQLEKEIIVLKSYILEENGHKKKFFQDLEKSKIFNQSVYNQNKQLNNQIKNLNETIRLEQLQIQNMKQQMEKIKHENEEYKQKQAQLSFIQMKFEKSTQIIKELRDQINQIKINYFNINEENLKLRDDNITLRLMIAELQNLNFEKKLKFGNKIKNNQQQAQLNKIKLNKKNETNFLLQKRGKSLVTLNQSYAKQKQLQKYNPQSKDKFPIKKLKIIRKFQ